MESEAISNQHSALYVDDDDQVRSFVGVILKHAGYAPIEARSCAEARRVLKEEAPRFVVLDIHLPDGNGFDLAEAWRNDGHASLPILFISGDEPTRCQAEADRLKAAFLHKPFRAQKFLELIASLVNKSE